MLYSWAAADTGMPSLAKCTQTNELKTHLVPKNGAVGGRFATVYFFVENIANKTSELMPLFYKAPRLKHRKLSSTKARALRALVAELFGASGVEL